MNEFLFIITEAKKYFDSVNAKYKTIHNAKRSINKDFKNGNKAVKFLCIALLEMKEDENKNNISDVLDFLNERISVLS